MHRLNFEQPQPSPEQMHDLSVAAPNVPAGAMKGMRKMQYEELPDEVIEAARRRRKREVAK
jgi:hypothetical protein